MNKMVKPIYNQMQQFDNKAIELKAFVDYFASSNNSPDPIFKRKFVQPTSLSFLAKKSSSMDIKKNIHRQQKKIPLKIDTAYLTSSKTRSRQEKFFMDKCVTELKKRICTYGNDALSSEKEKSKKTPTHERQAKSNFTNTYTRACLRKTEKLRFQLLCNIKKVSPKNDLNYLVSSQKYLQPREETQEGKEIGKRRKFFRKRKKIVFNKETGEKDITLNFQELTPWEENTEEKLFS